MVTVYPATQRIKGAMMGRKRFIARRAGKEMSGSFWCANSQGPLEQKEGAARPGSDSRPLPLRVGRGRGFVAANVWKQRRRFHFRGHVVTIGATHPPPKRICE